MVDEKHSAIVIPGFLPARGQRQFRALSPLSAADPRHSVETVRGLQPPALLLSPWKSRSSLHYNQTTWTRWRKETQIQNFPPRLEKVPPGVHPLSSSSFYNPPKSARRGSLSARFSMFAFSAIFHSPCPYSGADLHTYDGASSPLSNEETSELNTFIKASRRRENIPYKIDLKFHFNVNSAEWFS